MSILSDECAKGQLQLLETGVFSDFTLICKEYEFKVHRAIITPCSTYFAKVCAGGFGFAEGTNSTITFNEDDPEIIARILYYLYTRKYNAGIVPKVGKLTAAGIENERKRQDKLLAVIKQKQANSKEKSNTTAPTENHLSATAVQQPVLLRRSGTRITAEDAKYHLLTHAEVYTCADRLGIEELKAYVCRHFGDISENKELKLFADPWFADLLAYIYDNTVVEKKPDHIDGNIGDTIGLRYRATMSALTHMLFAPKVLPVVPEIEQVIKLHEPVAWEVSLALRKCQTKCNDQALTIGALNANLAATNDAVDAMKASKLGFGKRVAAQVNNYLGNVKRCEGCAKKLEVLIFSLTDSPTNPNQVILGITCRGCNHVGTAAITR